MLYNNDKLTEMKKDAVNDIIECLENGYNGYYCDLHNEVFNTDYYIIGTYQAKEYLNEYGIFEAIEEVQEYENNNFGEVFTNIANPEKLVNMLYYIIGEEVIIEIGNVINEFWNCYADNDTNNTIIEVLKEML